MAVELDSNKSKKSLAMIYEEEYQRDVHGVEKDDPKAAVKDELGRSPMRSRHTIKSFFKIISRLFKAIVFKLDALSNFHATPRKTKDELNVRALKPNISAIDMEVCPHFTRVNFSVFLAFADVIIAFVREDTDLSPVCMASILFLNMFSLRNSHSVSLLSSFVRCHDDLTGRNTPSH